MIRTCIGALLAIALVAPHSALGGATHTPMCDALAATYLSSQAPRPEVDAYVEAIVCAGALPPQSELNALGIRTDYPVGSTTPVSLLYNSDKTIASRAHDAICPTGTPLPAQPDLKAILRSLKIPDINSMLDDCLVKSYLLSDTCGLVTIAGNTALFFHSTASSQKITAINVNGAPFTVAGLPLTLSRYGVGIAFLPRPINAIRRLDLTTDSGGHCIVESTPPPDVVTVKIEAYGRGITCPPAAVFDLNDSRGDDCGSNSVPRSRTYCLGTDFRKKPGTTPSSARYTSNCPDGYSAITAIQSDPNSQCVTAGYHLQGCGMTKLDVGPISVEWCNGRAWLGESIIVPIVQLTAANALTPDVISYAPSQLPWFVLAYFTPRMAQDFALQGFDWSVDVIYSTKLAPGPTRTATLNPGSPTYLDTQENRCFAAFFSQRQGGLLLLASSRAADCKDSIYSSSYEEILKVGDPCTKRADNGLPIAANTADCSKRCD
jgi:hypothetical protein